MGSGLVTLLLYIQYQLLSGVSGGTSSTIGYRKEVGVKLA
jgi:hypothetical protein